MDAMTEIKSLVACEDRRAGTEGERRAAEHLAARLRSLGRDAELEPAVVRPDYPLTYVLHILLALAGGAVAMRWPKLGAAALLVAIGSAVGDSYGRFHLLRRLTRSAVTHRRALDPQRTIFLNVDEAGYGTVRYAIGEGRGVADPHTPTLSELCDEIRAADRA